MSLLIVTSRYLKSGTAKTKSQRKNYTKYIATRESVEVREQSKKYSTENQKKLLNELLNDFPESKKYLEFEDYKNNPTQLAVIILYFSGVPAHIKSQSEPINFAEFSFKLFGSIFSNFIMESFGRPAPLSTDKAENNARAPSDFERFFDFTSTDLIRSK